MKKVSKPRISIILPSYNQGDFLEQAILSVLNQGYPEMELIVMDGGSTDGSRPILEKYADRLAYWESVPDRGQGHAINKGFARATGEIITFLSSDDYYLPGTFIDVEEHFQRNPKAGAIVGGFAFLDANHEQPNAPIPPFIDGPTPVDLTLGPPGKYRLHQAATFYTRDALDSVGRHVREDYCYVMDRELLYRICRQFPVTLSEKTYGVFRRHPDSKSVSDILPFAREFADLYLSALTGESASDHLRKRMASYRMSRGHLKYCQKVRVISGLKHLILAGILYPINFSRRNYWNHFLEK